MQKKPKNLRPLTYREHDAIMVGDMEPTWPSAAEQLTWTVDQRQRTLAKAFLWYNITQDQKRANEWLAQWLEMQHNHVQLAGIVRKWGHVTPVIGWLTRSSMMGLTLKFSELRKIYAALVKMIKLQKQDLEKQARFAPTQQAPKVNIQDVINEKIADSMGLIQAQLDDFIAAGCQGEPNCLPALMERNVPANRVRELSSRFDKLVSELELLLAGKTPVLTEGWSNLPKRQQKALLQWVKTAQQQMLSYGTLKTSNRKPRARKSQTPMKMVSKLKLMHKHEELKISSINPVDILKASEVWFYNTKNRKLGVYLVDDTQTTLYVKGNKILGFNETTSVSKTLRKPEQQLKEFLKLGKPASKKWFADLKTTTSPVNGRGGDDIVFIKAFK